MYWLIWILSIVAVVYHIIQLIRGKTVEWFALFWVILGWVVVVMALVGLFVQTT